MAKKKKAAAKKPPTKKTAKSKAAPKKKPVKKKAAEPSATMRGDVPAYYQTLADQALDVIVGHYPLFAWQVMRKTAFLRPDAIWFAIRQIEAPADLLFELADDGVQVTSEADKTRTCFYTFESLGTMARSYDPLRNVAGLLNLLSAAVTQTYPAIIDTLVPLHFDKCVELVKRMLYSGFPVFEYQAAEGVAEFLAGADGVLIRSPASTIPAKHFDVSWPALVDLLLEMEPRETSTERAPTATTVQSPVDVQTINRDGQLASEQHAKDMDDSELLDEIERLAQLCKEAEAELANLKEETKAAKKVYEGRCVDLLRKIAERHNDSDRPLFSQAAKEAKQTRAEEIAGREVTQPTDAPIGSDPANQMEWQKVPTTELHLAEVIDRLKKETAEQIEASYPTMGELVDLHHQGTGKGKGIRSIIGIGPKMADAIIELVDNWLAKVRDGWGQPAAGHEDFTGQAADADNEPTDVVTKDEEAELAAPSDEYLEILWQGTRVDELQLKPALIRKLKADGLPTVAAIEARRASGVPLAEFPGLNINEISDLAGELDAGRDWHHHVQRIKHELTSGARPYAVPLAGECEAFDDGLRAGLDDGSSLLAESRELVDDDELLILWMGGFVHGRSMPREAAA